MSRALLRSLRFMRPYWRAAAGAFVAVLVSAAADLAAPQVLRAVIDRGIRAGRLDLVFRGSLLLIALALGGGIATFLEGYLSARASQGAAFDMRDAIFGKLQRLSFSYHDRAQAGQLITRVTSDVDLVREFVGAGLVHAISAAIMLVGAVGLLLSMNARLTLVALLAVPGTLWVLFRFVSRLGPMFRAFQETLGRLNAVLQESIAGVRVVKAFGREPFERVRYGLVNGELLERGLEVRNAIANAFPLLFFVGQLGIVAVTSVGAVQVSRGTLSVGELVAFTAYLSLLLQPLFVIGFGAQAIARSGASAQRVFEVLDAAEEVAERPDAEPLPEPRGRVEFEDVVFRYPGDDHDTLAGISLVIEPGETVAIVGATGSGKTTLVNLVPRFYDVSHGAVRIDGRDVRDLTLSSLRSRIGVVMQDSVLFSGTVAENIAYGRPGATAEEIRDAARVAQADEFISRLPEGYDTRVGERGVKLSGGQRQRIAIARALLIDPPILIMDDSTSSVDVATEAALRRALDALARGRTTLVVAQRLSTVRRADRIVLLEAGRVEDVGTHDELLERSCLYAEIAESQLLGEDERTQSAAAACAVSPDDPPDARAEGVEG